MPETKSDSVNEQGGSQHDAAPSDAVPARIELDTFIEAVTRGVARAVQAEDEVSGYLLVPPSAGPIIIGLILPPTDGPRPKPGPIMPAPPVAKKPE